MTLLRKVKRKLLYKFGRGYSISPEMVTVELNYDCIFHCKICQMWAKDFKISRLGGNRILSKSEIESIIRELSFMGVKCIHFCGGGPFFKRGIFRHCGIL